MIHCLIVDDEPLARQVIREHLSSFPGWTVVKECINATEAWEALHTSDIQVLFLDVQMPGINGIDFFRSLRLPPLVVFTSAHSQYAVDGFDLRATDYLLKPITEDRFRQAVIRVQEQLQRPVLEIKEVAQPESRPTSLSSDHVFLKLDNRLLKVDYTDILFLEAHRDFTKIYLREKDLLVGLHLKLLEEMLPEGRFIRVHRSYIIHTAMISHIEGNRVFIRKYEIPIGSNYKDQLMKTLGL